MGGLSQRDYRKLLPPRSYINVEDFDSAKELAEFLHYQDKNAIAYKQYHARRKEHEGKL